jgi:hypothetical protein
MNRLSSVSKKSGAVHTFVRMRLGVFRAYNCGTCVEVTYPDH